MSRFVSAGGNDDANDRDEAWLKAQKQLDEAGLRRKEATLGQQEGGKSLYEVLQANKAAKQEAFEESTRLKNQFRSLDEDEVDFLDSVLESTRAKDAAIQKETTEQLDSFRKQQEEAEKAARAEQDNDISAEPEAGETWQVLSRKRRKGRGGDSSQKTSKLRKLSSSEAVDDRPDDDDDVDGSTILRRTSSEHAKTISSKVAQSAAQKHDIAIPGKSTTVKDRAESTKPPPSTGLGLVAYSSDEDD